MAAPVKYLTANELVEHPEFKLIYWPLEPAKSGYVDVAHGRGGPLKMYYEVHGTGPTKLVWIMGLGGTHRIWQRQTQDFGHRSDDKYSVLIFDNRGIGRSAKPLMRYSTSEMAKDLLELLQHLSWTSPRSLHVIGLSMGGMIAQEFAYANPSLIASVTFMSTAARLVNTIGFFENLRRRIIMFLPKSPDQQVAFAASLLFSDEWLARPDEINGAFAYNRDRFAAGEVAKRYDKESYQAKAFILQAIAAGWHHKSGAQLKKLADEVGRDRIQVLHGDTDNMISVPHAHTLVAELGPGVESKLWPGVGHCILIERRQELKALMDAWIAKTAALGV